MHPLRGDLAQDTWRVARDPFGQRAPLRLAEFAARLEIIGEVQHLARIVPPGIPYRMKTHRVEHAPIALSMPRGTLGCGRSVQQLGSTPAFPSQLNHGVTR